MKWHLLSLNLIYVCPNLTPHNNVMTIWYMIIYRCDNLIPRYIQLQDTLQLFQFWKWYTRLNSSINCCADCNFQVDLLLGKAYSDWGHISDAVAVYDQLISSHPEDFRGYLAKVSIHLRVETASKVILSEYSYRLWLSCARVYWCSCCASIREVYLFDIKLLKIGAN